MIQATAIRKGMVLDMDGDLFTVLDFHHLTPGNKRGVIQLRLRSLSKGNSTQKKLRSEDRVELANLEERNMEYLYEEGDKKVFMDQKDFEQYPLGSDLLEEAGPYIAVGQAVKVSFHEGRPISINLPPSIVLAVSETAPGLRGDSVSNVFKPAKLESGLETQVPLFIENGDRVKVDTKTGKYLERA